MPSKLTIRVNKDLRQTVCDTNMNSKRIHDCTVIILGTFYNRDGAIASEDDMYEAYLEYGTKLYDYLDGVGTVIIIDHQTGLYAFTDYFNSHLSLFYTVTKDELILTTDLLYLTDQMDRLSISMRAARKFMLHGMVYGDKTLIQGVHKLPAGHYLEVDIRRCRIHCGRCHYRFEAQSKIGIPQYNAVFGKCMEECYRKDAAMTLSGGFDTNFIMYYLQRIKEDRKDSKLIRAYCGGGFTGKDETPFVKEMASFYGNIDLHTFYIDPESIQDYPEIVLGLQGQCFEDGIFLHFQMAKLFQKDNIRYVYTGDLADQILNQETYRYTKETYKRIVQTYLKGIKNVFLHRKWDHYRSIFRGRYETAALKNLKKGGLLWDYFGAEGIYPYARRQFISIAKSISVPGDYNKSFHRKAVLETVDPVLAQKIQRNGGNTDPAALFNEQTREALKAEVKKMPWFKERRYVDENQQLGYELRILYIDLVRRIFICRELEGYNRGEYPLLKDMYPSFR